MTIQNILYQIAVSFTDIISFLTLIFRFKYRDTLTIMQCMTLINETHASSLENVQLARIQAFSQIYCQGPILSAVQEAGVFADSKYFVDMALKRDPVETLKAFYAMGDKIRNKTLLKEFVETNFDPPGSELELCELYDWKRRPKTVYKIKDYKLRKWAKRLNVMWKELCRRVKDDVYNYPELYSMLYVPHPFIIPGGRFREFYYWDTYWILKGLLFSELYETSRGVIRNFIYLIGQYGFVPNGGRVYYLLRSQPPMLTAMVYDYYQATGDVKFVREVLAHLENEYNFWTSKRSIEMREQSWRMFQYTVLTNIPRPESYREDVALVTNMSIVEKELVWSNIASAAETGWDFSSRWFARNGTMKSIRTKNIVPVDLNAFMCMNTRLLSELFDAAGDRSRAVLFAARFIQAKAIMQQIHWHRQDGVWYDYDLEHHHHRREYYLSNVLPLFAHCYDDDDENIPKKVFRYMQRVGAFNMTKGIPTSFIKSDQQWDSANAWPPLMHMLIEGFRTSNDAELKRAAERLAIEWLQSNLEAFDKTESMFEKYNISINSTFAGSGGEYEVQTGFGWTNGVVLDLLSTYGHVATSGVKRTCGQRFVVSFMILFHIFLCHLVAR